MPLQFWITLVLALGMMETTVLFAQYLKWNDYGSLSIGVTFVALLCGVLKVRKVINGLFFVLIKFVLDSKSI